MCDCCMCTHGCRCNVCVIVVCVVMAAGVICCVAVADFIGTASGRHVVGTGTAYIYNNTSKLQANWECTVILIDSVTAGWWFHVINKFKILEFCFKSQMCLNYLCFTLFCGIYKNQSVIQRKTIYFSIRYILVICL